MNKLNLNTNEIFVECEVHQIIHCRQGIVINDVRQILQ